jgi:putative SOS response-associated peptidase YedK
LEQAADGTDARRDPIGRRQAHPQDDALGPAAALGERREALLFDVQRQVGRLTTKPAFRDAWKGGQRCLVVTDGFYEWKKITVKEKHPYAIATTDGMMIMAGLWSRWKDPKSGDEVLSCTVLTCAPNDVMAELHDRMPVILLERDWSRWLGEQPASDDELLALLKSCPDEALKIWPVGKAVGNVKNKGPQLAMAV